MEERPKAPGRTAVPHHRGIDLRLPRHTSAPDPADLDAVRTWVETVDDPTAIDLFCGAGGLSLGLQDAGFSVLVGADHDARAVESHTANLGGLGYVGDLSEPRDLLEQLHGWGIEHVDLIAGGVPCQPFSRAGQSMIRNLVEQGVRSQHDPRVELWQGFMTVVAELEPRAVLVENVPDLPSWDDGAVLLSFYESLRTLGYSVDARVLDGFRFGVPQHRARLILVGMRDGVAFTWPAPLTAVTTLREAIDDLPPVPPAQRAESLPYDAASRSPFQQRMRRDVADVDANVVYDHITRDVRPDDWEAFQLLGEGQTYIDLPERLRRYRSDIFTDKYKRLAWNELSRTITAHIAKDGYWYIHPEQHRTLSIREAARIQTFPDWFRFAGHPSLRYRQIGNAVPPLLGEAVGRSINEALATGRRDEVEHPHFRESIVAWNAERHQTYPWREGRSDPWTVLMGELLLTRTRPALVTAMLGRLCELAPSPGALVTQPDAAARLESVGMGSRSHILLDVAHHLVERFGGHVPEDEYELRSLPGVGEHIVQAVRCFAFRKRAVLLDAATERLLGRYVGRGDLRRWQKRLDLHRLAGQPGPDAEFNRAVLELALGTCRAERPHCAECPLAPDCASAETGQAGAQLLLVAGGAGAA